ncbi:MAG: hypothetical protein EZS28_030856, partial [Streblomastix strix]
ADLHGEEVRSKFVQFEGKKVLTVKHDNFISGSHKNDWTSIFPQFAQQICSFIGKDTQQMIECNFSNTTPTDRICSHITLMDVCKNYFDYSMMEMCGIPWIELMGTVDDWKLVQQKTASLRNFQLKSDKHLQNWINSLLPALDHFVSAAKGHPDPFFWGSVCNLEGLYGQKGASQTGWIQALFPYTNDGSEVRPTPNMCVIHWHDTYQEAKKIGVIEALKKSQSQEEYSYKRGINMYDIPSGLSKAPVKITWSGKSEQQDLVFYGGITAAYQNVDGSLECRTGWAVVELPKKM